VENKEEKNWVGPSIDREDNRLWGGGAVLHQNPGRGRTGRGGNCAKGGWKVFQTTRNRDLKNQKKLIITKWGLPGKKNKPFRGI